MSDIIFMTPDEARKCCDPLVREWNMELERDLEEIRSAVSVLLDMPVTNGTIDISHPAIARLIELESEWEF